MKENKMIEATVIENKTLDEKPQIHDSVKKKYCFQCENNTLLIRPLSIEGMGVCNICDECHLKAEMILVKEKYNGDTKEMLKQNAIAAGQKAKAGALKLFKMGKEFFS